MNQRINIQRLSHSLILITLATYILVVGKFFLQPIFFAVFFMFILKPLCDRFERLVRSRGLSILLALFITLIPLGGVIWIFWIQAMSIFRNLDSLGNRLKVTIIDFINSASDYLPIAREDIIDTMINNVNTIINSSISIVRTGFSSSTYILASLLLALIYTFFLLYYRSAIKEFFIVQSVKSKQERARETMQEIQDVIMRYCYGMIMVIGILGVMNSVGLYIVGIDYPIFWGLLASFLAIIPFIGTTLGGFFPFIYAIATTTTLWQPVAVVIMYTAIQQIEANIITPNVIGSSIRINPMVAIMSMILGGALWGISGLVLALPATAIIRLLMDKVDQLKTLSLLMSSGLSGYEADFRQKYNEDKYRIPTMFKNYIYEDAEVDEEE